MFISANSSIGTSSLALTRHSMSSDGINSIHIIIVTYIYFLSQHRMYQEPIERFTTTTTTIATLFVLAWAILPLDFRINFGIYYFRSWRLLNIIYSSFFLISAFLISFGPESPKYLVSRGHHDEAVRVLQIMYAGNTGKSPKDYPIRRLTSEYNKHESGKFLTTLKMQTLPLFKPYYLKWLLHTGILLIGVYATATGLYIWVPDVLNRILTSDIQGATTCQVIVQRLNETSAEGLECNDTIDRMTFLINSVASVGCAIVGIIVSTTINFIEKKTLLYAVYFSIGTFCILVNFLSQQILVAVLLTTLSLLGLAIGPVNAYAVEIFPTHVRGMALSLIVIISRTGSIISTNVVGMSLKAACEVTFYVFGGLLYICGISVFLLPKSKASQKLKKKTLQTRL